MKVLVTGGAGFFGSHVCEALLSGRQDVISYDNYSTGRNLLQSIRYVKGDILDQSKLDRTLRKVDAVIHLAARLGTPELFSTVAEATAINIVGTVRVLEACKKSRVKKIVFASKPNPPEWLNPYTVTKKACEDYCGLYYEEFGLPVTILAYLNMYGPRQRSHPVQKFMPTFIEHALQNKPLPIWGSGKQTVDAVFVKDAAEATVASLRREEAIGKVMDIGTGVATKVIDVARLVISMCNSKSTVEFKPMRRGEPPSYRLVGDISKAEKIIGWRARTALQQGLRLTIPFYVEQKKRTGQSPH